MITKKTCVGFGETLAPALCEKGNPLPFYPGDFDSNSWTLAYPNNLKCVLYILSY